MSWQLQLSPGTGAAKMVRRKNLCMEDVSARERDLGERLGGSMLRVKLRRTRRLGEMQKQPVSFALIFRPNLHLN